MSAYSLQILGLHQDLERLRSNLERWDTSGLRLLAALGDKEAITFLTIGPPCHDGDAIIQSLPSEHLVLATASFALLERAGTLLLRALAVLPKRWNKMRSVSRQTVGMDAW